MLSGLSLPRWEGCSNEALQPTMNTQPRPLECRSHEPGIPSDNLSGVPIHPDSLTRPPPPHARSCTVQVKGGQAQVLLSLLQPPREDRLPPPLGIALHPSLPPGHTAGLWWWLMATLAAHGYYRPWEGCFALCLPTSLPGTASVSAILLLWHFKNSEICIREKCPDILSVNQSGG